MLVLIPQWKYEFQSLSKICLCQIDARYDFVEVEDISETSTIIRGRWCGYKEVPPRITSRTNQIKITFKSDDYFVAKPGFKIYYSFVVSNLTTLRLKEDTSFMKYRDHFLWLNTVVWEWMNFINPLRYTLFLPVPKMITSSLVKGYHFGSIKSTLGPYILKECIEHRKSKILIVW